MHIGGNDKPHDALFRRIFSDTAAVAAELRMILPRVISRHVDWDSLERVPGEFVSKQLKRLWPDLVFRARLLDDPDTWVYFMIEHQARNDRWMALRFLGYMYFFWDDFVQKHPKAEMLPGVIPVAVHVGTDKLSWTAPTELGALINFGRVLDGALHRELEAYVPSLKYTLDEIATMSPEDLIQRPLAIPAILALILQRIGPHNPDLFDDLTLVGGLFDRLVELPGGRDLLDTFVEYLVSVARIDPDILREHLTRISPALKEAVMTVLEAVETRSEARGRAHIITMLLEHKFGPLPEWVLDAIGNAELEQLDTWTLNLLTATGLDDVFASCVQPQVESQA